MTAEKGGLNPLKEILNTDAILQNDYHLKNEQNFLIIKHFNRHDGDVVALSIN